MRVVCTNYVINAIPPRKCDSILVITGKDLTFTEGEYDGGYGRDCVDTLTFFCPCCKTNSDIGRAQWNDAKRMWGER